MGTPQARLSVAGHDVLILGTIAGFVPDGERVRQAYDAFHPSVVALGVPPEDLAALDHLASVAGAASPPDLPPLDEAQERLLAQLAAFGATRIPSPDLEAAHACAKADGVAPGPPAPPGAPPPGPVNRACADAEHAALFTRHVKFWHVVQSNAIKSRLLKHGVTGADVYEVAANWDAAWNKPAGLRHLETDREAHMATQLRDVCRAGSVLAIVPSTRLAGILRSLGAGKA